MPVALIVIALIILRSVPYILLVTLIAVICQYETTKAFFSAGYHPNRRTGFLFGLLLYPAYLLSPTAPLVLFAILVTYNLIWGVFDSSVKFEDAIVSCFVLCYPGSFFLAFILIGNILPYDLSVFIMAIALLSPVMSDLGAYFIGINFGKRKLAPAISPNKTVEGAIGGIVSSLFVVGLLLVIIHFSGLFDSFTSVMEIPWYHVMICTLFCTIFSQLGDLVASALKRFAGIKDYSQLLLGHGGVMDRMDSMLFSVTVAVLYFNSFVVM